MVIPIFFFVFFLEKVPFDPDAVDHTTPSSMWPMFNKIRNWRVRRIVARHPIAESLWRDALQRCTPARRLGASDQATLGGTGQGLAT
jgi:hypothetical protein